MREIRFRAWNNIKKEMFQVVKLDLKNKTVWDRGLGYIINNPNQDIKLLQFTGLKDVNGKEIYEDDVCECVGGESAQGVHEFQEIGKVVFKDGCFGIENKENEFLPFFYLIEHGFEIFNCGSIYENPELLEVSE